MNIKSFNIFIKEFFSLLIFREREEGREKESVREKHPFVVSLIYAFVG